MGERSVGISATTKPPEGRLDSWKEIAAYLNRDVTTVQRWEKREGMPVHRHLHDRMGSVYAWRSELDTWSQGRNVRLAEAESTAPASTGASRTVANTILNWKVLLLLVAVAIALGTLFKPGKSEQTWRNRIANAHFQRVTDFDEVEQSAVLSRDGQLVAFLSGRDGQMDVWLTQVGSGQFHNLTHGTAPELVNPSIRSLGFTPDGSLVTYWVRRKSASDNGEIGIWAVPTLGGEPRPYLEGVAECDWSHDGSQLVYHTPGPGDPMYISRGNRRADERPIFTASAGLHSHFPVWSPDGAFIYFVQGALPDKLDLWRIPSVGGTPQRITSQNTRITYPVLLDKRTLVYLATDPDGSGPWLYTVDVDSGEFHRLNSGPDRYTSLAASADGSRLVATLATPRETLWRLLLADGTQQVSQPVQLDLATGNGSKPRIGRDYFLYVSTTATSESIWKFSNKAATELWRGEGAIITGAPAISSDGRVAFSARQHEKNLLYVMQPDGTDLRIVTTTVELQGTPAWAPDNQSIIVAANDRGLTHLFRVPLNGGSPAEFAREYSVDPVWSPDKSYVVYSGPDIGTTFSVRAVKIDGAAHAMPTLTLTRGARHLAFLPGSQTLLFLRGEIRHKNLWTLDLTTGTERQVTNVPPDFEIEDFDVSPDGRELVLQRTQERSNIVLLNLDKR